MNALFFILFTFLLVVVQTIILPTSDLLIQSFDLMIINILFLSLFSSHSAIALTLSNGGRICVPLIIG